MKKFEPIYIAGGWAHDMQGNTIQAGTYEPEVADELGEDGPGLALVCVEDPSHEYIVSANEFDQIIKGFSRWWKRFARAKELAVILGSIFDLDPSAMIVFNSLTRRTEIRVNIGHNIAYMIAPAEDMCKLLITEIGRAFDQI